MYIAMADKGLELLDKSNYEIKERLFEMKILFTIILTSLLVNLQAQINHTHVPDRAIVFPDVAGYLTLKADLHMHTVFSDGEVWPSVRVQEAQRDSLDIISLTEHLEYQEFRQSRRSLFRHFG